MAAPNAPQNLHVLNYSRDGSVVTLAWEPPSSGDDPTRYELQANVDSGGWNTIGILRDTETEFCWASATPATSTEFRVRASNADGDSAYLEALSATEVGIVPVEDSDPSIRFAIHVGEYLAGTSPVDSLAARNTSGNPTPTYGGDTTWGLRNDVAFAPFVPQSVFTWNHVGNALRVASITPNSPSAGTTRVTLTDPHGRPTSSSFEVSFSGTGLSDVDDPDHFMVTAISSTVVDISGFVASGSASTGLMNRPSFDNYRGDSVVLGSVGRLILPNGHTDSSYSGTGAYPSVYHGPEHGLLAKMQDDVLASASPSDFVCLMKVAGGDAGRLRSRADNNSVRWLKQFDSAAKDASSGRRLSAYADLRQKLRDCVLFLANDASQSGKPRVVDHIALSFGLNETNANMAAVPRTLSVASVAIAGSTATFTTTTDIGLSEPGSTNRLVAKIQGFSSDTLSVNGTIQEIQITGARTFTLREVNATGLATPAGAATVSISDPIFLFREDLARVAQELRELCITELGSAQDAEDIPVVFTAVNPLNGGAAGTYVAREAKAAVGDVTNARVADFQGFNRQPSASIGVVEGVGAISLTGVYTFHANYLSSGVAAIEKPAGGFNASGLTEGMFVIPSSTASNNSVRFRIGLMTDTLLLPSLVLGASVVNESAVTATLSRAGNTFSNVFYDPIGERELGDAIYAAKTGSRVFSIGSARTPAIVCVMAAHSYGMGVSNLEFALLKDPLLISPRTGGIVLPRRKVWVHDRQALENMEVGALGPTARTNFNRDPEWNYVQLNNAADYTQCGIQPSLMLSLTEQFPDEDVHFIGLAKGGATLANYSGIPANISFIRPEATRVLIGISTRFIQFDRPFSVTIAGVSNLSVSINGTHTATPIHAGYGVASGTQVFSIPVTGVTGSANISGATASYDEGVWDPSVAGNLFDSFKAQLDNFYEYLWDQGRIPDVRLLTVMLGVNDATVGAQGEFAGALDRFVGEMRSRLTTHGKPREFGELPIVWLNPILHNDLGANASANLPEIRDALSAKAAADPWFALLSRDETSSFDTDRARISDDRVHPTLTGYVNLGYDLGRSGPEGIGPWRGRHPIVNAQP